jgi:hypothetical protein
MTQNLNQSGESMQNHLNPSKGSHRTGSDPVNQTLQQALAERKRLLERYPHLQTYQDEIDRILDKSGSSQGRMAVLGMLMQDKLITLQKELLKLVEILQ